MNVKEAIAFLKRIGYSISARPNNKFSVWFGGREINTFDGRGLVGYARAHEKKRERLAKKDYFFSRSFVRNAISTERYDEIWGKDGKFYFTNRRDYD